MRYDSRYRDADTQMAPAHDYDSMGRVVISEDTETPKINTRATLYRLTTLPLPDPPEDTYQVDVTDNFPIVANEVLGDQQKWWLVAEANPQIRHPLDLKTADVIYIP